MSCLVFPLVRFFAVSPRPFVLTGRCFVQSREGLSSTLRFKYIPQLQAHSNAVNLYCCIARCGKPISTLPLFNQFYPINLSILEKPPHLLICLSWSSSNSSELLLHAHYLFPLFCPSIFIFYRLPNICFVSGGFGCMRADFGNFENEQMKSRYLSF